MGNRKKKKIMKRVLAVMLSLALAFTLGISVMPETVRADDKIDFNVSSTYIEVTPNFDWPIVYDGNEHDLTDVTVKVNGVQLVKGTDYTVEYDKDYWSVAAKADGISTATGVIGSSTETLDFPIIVKGKGNYTGTWRSESNGSGYYSNYANDGRYRIMPHVSESVTINIPGEWEWTLGVDGTLTLEGMSAMPDGLNANNEVYGWRDYKQYIKKVVFNITGTVTSICDSAFAGCANLKEVILPALNGDQGLVSIGPSAFDSCLSLRSIHLANSTEMPSTLTTIKSRALGINTYNLEAHLPDNVSTIEINNVRDYKLFSSFQRLDETRNRNVEGTGLGLNITRQLSEMMGGGILAESEYGKGSVFTVDILQKVVDDTPIGDYNKRLEKASLQKEDFRTALVAPDAKILIVDDNEMNLDVITGLLQDTRIRTSVALSGRECIDILRKDRFDIIFLDQMMPGLSGVQTLELIRKEGLATGTPIIVLTADAIMGARESYIKEGFSDYLSKPVSYNEMEDLLYQYLDPALIVREDQLKEKEKEKAELPLVLVISESSEKLRSFKELFAGRYKGVFVKDEASAEKFLSKHKVEFVVREK